MPNRENPCKYGGGRALEFGHMGGTGDTGDPNSWFPELWDWLLAEFQPKTALDVGCGIGRATQYFLQSGLSVVSLDCEQMRLHHLEPHTLVGCDISQKAEIHPSDLVWCCEFAEHVEPDSVENVIQTLAESTLKVLALCAAPEGAGGYHHVNCQNEPYWIRLLEAAGLLHRPDLTEYAKSLCKANYGRTIGNYFARSGLIFTRASTQPLLPAFADEKLSVEGAEQLVRMAEDETVTTVRGQDLPLADRDVLMNAAKERLEGRHD